MTTLWRAQVTLKHKSGLPRDSVTNTWWFDAVDFTITEAAAEAVAERLRAFYVVDPGAAQAAPIMNYLSISLAATGHEIKMAPIDSFTGEDTRGEAFPPMWTEVFDFVGWAPNATPLPSEAACCLSMKNLGSSAAPPRQRRGRVFIGSLGQNAGEQVANVLRPAQAFREDLGAAANLMADAQAAAATPLVVFSRPYAGREELERPGNPRGPLPALPARAGSIYPVTDFWIDNAFDTQRKRGERATLRTAV